MDSRHPFSLDAELARWRQSLAAHESLTPERAAELETHLRDEIAALQAKDLSPAEAFLIASRRLGDVADLSAQFTTADPATVWRNRIFWIAAGVLVVPFTQHVTGALATAVYFFCAKVGTPALGSFFAAVIPLLFIGLTVGLLVGLAHGRWPRLAQSLDVCCSRRQRWAWPFLALAAVPFAALVAFWAYLLFTAPAHASGPASRILWFTQSLYLLFPIALAVLAAAYAPLRPRPTALGR